MGIKSKEAKLLTLFNARSFLERYSRKHTFKGRGGGEGRWEMGEGSEWGWEGEGGGRGRGER